LIPESDRKLFDADAWLSATVALDVLATALGKLASAEADTTALVTAALELAQLGGHNDADTADLLAKADGDIGNARAAIAPRLATPEAVTSAITLLRDGAEALVDEARLALETSQMTRYRKG
jgi:hypothetical protein